MTDGLWSMALTTCLFPSYNPGGIGESARSSRKARIHGLKICVFPSHILRNMRYGQSINRRKKDRISERQKEMGKAPMPEQRESFDAFYRRISRPFWLYIFRVCGDEGRADEVFQESFCRFLKKAPAVMGDPQKKAYLYRTAFRLIIDQARHRKVEREAWRDMKKELWSDRDSPLYVDMEKTFGLLKPKERNLLWLAYVEGQNHREIGKILGTGERSVKVLLFRARKKLASLLKDKGYPDRLGREKLE